MGKRQPVTIQLTPGRDDDLIAWIASLPRSDYRALEDGKNSVLKQALRYAVNGGQAIKVSRPDRNEASRLRAEIQELRQQVTALSAENEELKVAVENSPTEKVMAVTSAEMVAQEVLDARKRNVQKAKW